MKTLNESTGCERAAHMLEALEAGDINRLFSLQSLEGLPKSADIFSKIEEILLCDNPCLADETSRVIENARKLLGKFALLPENFSLGKLVESREGEGVFEGWYGRTRVIIRQVSCRGSRTGLLNLLAEAEILARVRHERVAGLLGLSLDSDGRLSMITEHYGTLSLGRAAKISPEFSRQARIRAVFHAAQAVMALHALSPSVVLGNLSANSFRFDGEMGVKLVDLSLASQYPQLPSFKNLPKKLEASQYSTLEDTPSQMPTPTPNHIHTHIPTPKSDIQDFGKMLNSLFPDLSSSQSLDPSIEPDYFSIQEQLRTLTRECLSVSESKRPSFEEICEKLHAISSACSS